MCGAPVVGTDVMGAVPGTFPGMAIIHEGANVLLLTIYFVAPNPLP